MRILRINIIVLLLSLVCLTTSTTIADSAVDKKEKAAAPIKQIGGYSNISNAKLQELIDDGVLLVDIRREEEWKHFGIIKGSKTMTFFDKTGRVSKDFLPKFTAIAKKDQPVVLICYTGARTKVASQAIAQQLGYKNVINVTNGIAGWIREKRPVVKYQQ